MNGPLSRDEYNGYVQEVQKILPETEVRQSGDEKLGSLFGYYWDGKWVTIGREFLAMRPEARRFIDMDEYHKALGRACLRWK